MPLGPNPNLLTLGDVASPRDSTTTYDWSYDPALTGSAAVAVTAGTVYLCRIPVPRTITITAMSLVVATAGAAAGTALNCFVGLYSPTLTRLGTTVDQQGNWSTAGLKTMSLVGSVTIAGGPSAYVLGALLVGTNFTTTACAFAGAPGGAAAAVNFGYPQRAVTSSTGQTSLPSTAGAVTQSTKLILMGLVP